MESVKASRHSRPDTHEWRRTETKHTGRVTRPRGGLEVRQHFSENIEKTSVKEMWLSGPKCNYRVRNGCGVCPTCRTSSIEHPLPHRETPLWNRRPSEEFHGTNQLRHLVQSPTHFSSPSQFSSASPRSLLSVASKTDGLPVGPFPSLSILPCMVRDWRAHEKWGVPNVGLEVDVRRQPRNHPTFVQDLVSGN